MRHPLRLESGGRSRCVTGQVLNSTIDFDASHPTPRILRLFVMRHWFRQTSGFSGSFNPLNPEHFPVPLIGADVLFVAAEAFGDFVDRGFGSRENRVAAGR